MSRLRWPIIWSALFGLWLARVPFAMSDPANARIEGVVFEKVSGKPVIGAALRIWGTDKVIMTGYDGSYAIDSLLPKSYGLEVAQSCYRGVLVRCGQLHSDEIRIVDIELEPERFLFADQGKVLNGPEVRRVLELRQRGAPYRDAYRAGWSAAEQEIATARAAICVYGLIRELPEVSAETGLPYRRVAWCVVDDDICGFADGYNSCIGQWLNRNGLPRWSRKEWAGVLKSRWSYFDSAARVAPPAMMTANCEPVHSPDGQWSVCRESDRARPDEERIVVTGETGTSVVEMSSDSTEDLAELVWGPPGSDIAIIRWRAATVSDSEDIPASTYRVLDLRTGDFLGRGAMPEERR